MLETFGPCDIPGGRGLGRTGRPGLAVGHRLYGEDMRSSLIHWSDAIGTTTRFSCLTTVNRRAPR